MGEPATGCSCPSLLTDPSSFPAVCREQPWLQALPQPILALDLFLREPADASQRTPAVRHRNRHHDFVCTRSIANPHFHAIEMAADTRGILLSKPNAEHNSQPAALFGRQNH